MCLIIFTTRAFDITENYLFHKDNYDKISLGKNLKKYWFTDKLKNSSQKLIDNIKNMPNFYKDLDKTDLEEFSKLKTAKDRTKLLIIKKIKQILENNLKKLEYDNLDTNILIEDDRWHNIYRIKGANVFAYYHLFDGFNGDKYEFIKALYNDIKKITNGISFKKVIFVLHDRDLGEKRDNYRIPDSRSEELKGTIGIEENVEFYLFQHSPGFSGIHGLLKKFPWDNFRDKPDKIAAYIKKQLPALDCKKKLYELKEELLLNLYPVIFPLEKVNTKLPLPDFLVDKIKNFINEKEIFEDCNYGKGGENIFSDLKEKLEIFLNKPADELLQAVRVKGLDDSKENKYLVIPEYFRAKFDEMLISYNKDEPIYYNELL